MASPTFFSDGHTPNRNDTVNMILQRILGALVDGAGGSGTGGLQGVVNPEGSVTADPGTTYWNSANQTFWAKSSGTGNVGWTQVV